MLLWYLITITVLDIIYLIVIYLIGDFSETDIFLRLQEVPAQSNPMERACLSLSTQSSLQNFLQIKDKTMH
jgi:hypothetical protein